MQKLDDHLSTRGQRSVLRRLHWTLGLGKVVPLYLLWQGVACTAIGLSLMVLPFDLIDSNVMTTIYYLIRPAVWGGIFLLLGLTCFAAVIWPRALWRHAMLFLIEVQALWAIGLTVPILLGARPINIIAPMAWTQVLGTTIIVLEHARRFTGSR